jgi:hypothetical protein
VSLTEAPSALTVQVSVVPAIEHVAPALATTLTPSGAVLQVRGTENEADAPLQMFWVATALAE